MKKVILLILTILLILSKSVLHSAEPTEMAQRLIELFKMQKIPHEGCWFASSYHSEEKVPGSALAARYGGGERLAGTAIYALETRVDFSALHKLKTDEIWHYYGGAPIEMLLLYPDGHGETLILGQDVFHGERPQIVVPQGVWQGSRPIGAYTFFGTTMAPGFDVADVEFADRADLQKRYPKYASLIHALTR